MTEEIMSAITVGTYLLRRLKEIGVDHIFGVPGDYNLSLLDEVIGFEGIEWIGTCNELNGAYASDGYSRVKGIGALITTFGMGELSAINGIAGSYAERCPIVNIVGMPSLELQKRKALLHHTLGGGDFHVFANMFQSTTVAQTLLKDHAAGKEIDRVLAECWKRKRPVYIGIPTDIVDLLIEAPTAPLDLSYPKSNPDIVREVVNQIEALIKASRKPVILGDVCAIRYGMTPYIERLINTTQIPFATMNMAKGIINESHPLFLGNYCGRLGTKNAQDRVEKSDLTLSFGTLLSDINTGGFTFSPNLNTEVQIHNSWIQIKHALYTDLVFHDVLEALIERLAGYRYSGEPFTRLKKTPTPVPQNLSQSYFWQSIESFLPKKSTVIADTGTSLFGAYEMTLPDQTLFISQPLWGSIGYSVGALLGAQTALPNHPTFLFVGDGSFQISAQEISSVLRRKLNPVVFLLNNAGYTIERLLHGPRMPYNDINNWAYAALPGVFGEGAEPYQVKTPQELQNTLNELSKPSDKLRFVEVFLPQMDAPEMLKNFVKVKDRPH